MDAVNKRKFPIGAPVFHQVGGKTIPATVVAHANKTIKIDQDDPDRLDMAYAHPSNLLHQHEFMADKRCALAPFLKVNPVDLCNDQLNTLEIAAGAHKLVIGLNGCLYKVGESSFEQLGKADPKDYDHVPYLTP